MYRVRLWLLWALIVCLGGAAIACGSKTPTSPTSQPSTPIATPPPAPAPAPPPAPPAPPPPPPPPNNRPTVTLVASSRHVDVNREINLTATITDDETPPSQMTVEWSAPSGSFTPGNPLLPADEESSASALTGTRTARYRAPSAAVVDKGPAFYDLTVKVTEPYTGADGPTQHIVTATYRVAVNNSPKELADLGGAFINDFADSSNSPEYCVRNFADECVGKRQEIADIRTNRARFTILSSQWSVRKTDIDYNADWATMEIRATFVSRVHNSNPPRNETATGDSLLTFIFINDRWYLCESRWRPVSTLTGPAFWGTP